MYITLYSRINVIFAFKCKKKFSYKKKKKKKFILIK